ncbi:hypothetical protein ACJX0J_035517, partial [Zea mays]
CTLCYYMLHTTIRIRSEMDIIQTQLNRATAHDFLFAYISFGAMQSARLAVEICMYFIFQHL